MKKKTFLQQYLISKRQSDISMLHIGLNFVFAVFLCVYKSVFSPIVWKASEEGLDRLDRKWMQYVKYWSVMKYKNDEGVVDTSVTNAPPSHDDGRPQTGRQRGNMF